MNNPHKYPAPDFPRKADWRWKDVLTWGIVLATGLLALLVLWTPLMLAPLSEMAGAFIRLHQAP